MITKEAASEAAVKLFSQWYLPPFLSTLQNKFGVVVKDPDRVQDLLKIASVLSVAENQHNLNKKNKEISAAETLVKHAADTIFQETTGINSEDFNNDNMRRMAAKNAVKNDAELRKAALVYGYMSSGGQLY
ncbi:MAG: hypothetical protein QW303_00430 [Nitrososphaerota archaeon]